MAMLCCTGYRNRFIEAKAIRKNNLAFDRRLPTALKYQIREATTIITVILERGNNPTNQTLIQLILSP